MFVVLVGDAQFSSVPFIRCDTCAGHFCRDHARVLSYKFRGFTGATYSDARKWSLCACCTGVVRKIAQGGKPGEGTVVSCGKSNCDASATTFEGEVMYSKFAPGSSVPVEMYWAPAFESWFCRGHVDDREVKVLPLGKNGDRHFSPITIHVVESPDYVDVGDIELTAAERRHRDDFAFRQVTMIFDRVRREVMTGGFEPDDSDLPG